MCHYFKDLLLLTVCISCSDLLSVYLFRFQLHLLFVFAAAMIMVNKDYQFRQIGLHADRCQQNMATSFRWWQKERGIFSIS